jgi:LmbE family N-acetylglucosaminyl deacetylase
MKSHKERLTTIHRPQLIDSLFERVMAIGPHPDDIELGCFGSLTRFHKNGAKIACMVMTCGGVGGDADLRRHEAEKCAAMLKAEIRFGELEDTKLPEGFPSIKLIEDFIADFKPTAIFVNSPNDTHQDHRNTAKAAISAARFAPIVLYYQTPSSTRSFAPQVFIDISEELDTKIKAVRVHESQGENVYMADKAVKGLAEFLGFQVYQGGKYFEGFEVHQIIV